MTAALRSIDCTTAEPAPIVPAAHVHDLIAANAQLERDLASARARNATLLRELRRAIEAPAIVGQSVVNGVLTLTYSNGRIMQHQRTAEYSDDATSYGDAWVEIAAPDTAKAIVTAAIDADDVDDALHACAGMAVI